MGSISTISRTLVNGIRRAACQPNFLRIPLGLVNKAPLQNKSAQNSLKLYYNYVALLKRVTRFTPLQFFGQPTVKTDPSQCLHFCLSLFGFSQLFIVLRILNLHLFILLNKINLLID